MPLFSLKFSPKKIPARKQQMPISSLHRNIESSHNNQDFDNDYGPIKMKLGDHDCVFQNGEWIVGGPNIAKDLLKLKKQNQKLVEENNLLKLKVDLLLDMLAESTAECEEQVVALDKLRSMRKSRK